MGLLSHKYYLIPSVPLTNLVADWNMINASGTTLTDVSGYGNNMTIVGSPTIADSPISGKTMKFDGTNTKYAITPQTNSLQLGSVGSFYWRMKCPNANQTNATVFSKLIYLGGSQIYCLCMITGAGNSADNLIAGKKISFSINSGTVGTLSYTTNDVIDGEYHDFVVTINNGVFKFYVDKLEVPATNPYNGQTNINTNGADWTIGINAYNRTDGKLTGDIDFLKIYNTVLSQSEITALYDNNPLPLPISDLIGYYRFNGNLNDLSSYNYNVVSSNGVAYTSDRNGVTGNALLVNGSSTQVNYGSISAFAMSDGTNDLPFTVSCWVNPSSYPTGETGRTICATINSATLQGINIINFPGYIYFFLYNGAGHTYGITVLQTCMTLNTWTHLVFTYNGNKTTPSLKVYANKIEITSAAYNTSYNGMSTSVGTFMIGTREANPQDGFQGGIDDLLIVKRVLTTEEINNL